MTCKDNRFEENLTTKTGEETGIIPLLSHTTKLLRRSWIIAFPVLIFGLIIVAITSLYIKSNVERIAEKEFISKCSEIKNRISGRLKDQARLLFSGKAFFDASIEVTRDEWHIFIRQQRLQQQLPGIQGLGFSLLIKPEDLNQHIQKIRNEGFPEYKVHPDGGRKLYTSTIYLEPFDYRNQRAFGYDMLSEPVRRAAMEKARDMNAAALSGKVLLVQETYKDVQAGALMYVPVYCRGMPINSVEQRRAAIRGWVFSPYRINNLLKGLLPEPYG